MYLFKETQQMDQWWIRYPLYLFTFGIIVSFSYAIVKQLYFGTTIGSKPTPDWALISISFISMIVTVAVFILIVMAKLETRLTKFGLEYKFWPYVFNWKKITKLQIETWEIIEYNPIIDYGGWGYRFRGIKNIAYTTKGKIGIKIKMTNGHTKLFGTQQPEALRLAMEKMMGEHNQEV